MIVWGLIIWGMPIWETPVVIPHIRPRDVLVDLHTVLPNRDICRTLVDPCPTVEIISSLVMLVERGMSVPAENAVGLMVLRVCQSASATFSDSRCQRVPSRSRKRVSAFFFESHFWSCR